MPLRIALACLAIVAAAAGGGLAQGAPQEPGAETREERIGELERRVVELLAEVTRARAERDRLRRLLDRIVGQGAQLESDRLLLTELRKDLPDTRVEAETYLRRLRSLALVSDPARLAPLATRMLTSGSIYLDWRHGAFDSADARSRAFAESGAHGFPTSLANFRNAVLLTVSNRLEGLLILVE